MSRGTMHYGLEMTCQTCGVVLRVQSDEAICDDSLAVAFVRHRHIDQATLSSRYRSVDDQWGTPPATPQVEIPRGNPTFHCPHCASVYYGSAAKKLLGAHMEQTHLDKVFRPPATDRAAKV